MGQSSIWGKKAVLNVNFSFAYGQLKEHGEVPGGGGR